MLNCNNLLSDFILYFVILLRAFNKYQHGQQYSRIGSDNSLVPIGRQAIIWTNVG